MTQLRVEPERSRRDRRAFLDLPCRLFRELPHWVPPLRISEKAVLDRRRNPFFRHADVEHFLARRGRRVVGRIAAIENRLHNETYGDRVGFFGFFDVEPDPEAARGLVTAARAWTAARGLDRVRGPVNYSTNDTCGVLVEGFEHAPYLLMPYNRPDYDALLRAAGLAGAKDLLAFWISTRNPVPERMLRVVERRLERSKVVIRPFDLSDVRGEISRLHQVYNRCWADNWGFVPATLEEFEHASGDMKHVLEPDLSAVAELDGRPVGMSLILRNLNELLHGTNGRLLSRALPRLLFGMRRIRTVRVVALGVVPEARGRGINEAFYVRAATRAIAKGYEGGEAGWILEDNDRMRRPVEAGGGVPYKRYRIYEGATAPPGGDTECIGYD